MLPILIHFVVDCVLVYFPQKSEELEQSYLILPYAQMEFVAKSVRRGIRAPVLVQTFYEVQGAAQQLLTDWKKKT